MMPSVNFKQHFKRRSIVSVYDRAPIRTINASSKEILPFAKPFFECMTGGGHRMVFVSRLALKYVSNGFCLDCDTAKTVGLCFVQKPVDNLKRLFLGLHSQIHSNLVVLT